MKSDISQIELVTNSNEFFYDVITKTIKERQFSLSVDAEFYVVNLLSHFVRTDHVFGYGEDGTLEDRPLAFLLKEAEDEAERSMKSLLFRQVGDIALYKVGLFPNKKVSSPYYGILGKIGYSNAAKHDYDSNRKDIYREMAGNFERIAYLLRAVPQFNGLK